MKFIKLEEDFWKSSPDLTNQVLISNLFKRGVAEGDNWLTKIVVESVGKGQEHLVGLVFVDNFIL